VGKKNKFIVKQQLQDNKIVSGNVLNIKDIQEALQEINSTGYMKGAIALQDNEESFAYTDVDLGVKDRFPFDLDLRFDNQGRSEVGLNRAVIFAGMYNLTGLGDKILSTTTLARHTVAQGIFYSVLNCQK
jgi:hemolysin activation/secretion protein